MVLYQVLHYDAVESDVSPGQQLLIQQLLSHEFHKNIFAFGLNFGQYTLIGCLFDLREFLQMFLHCQKIAVLSSLLITAFSFDRPSMFRRWSLLEGTTVVVHFLLVSKRTQKFSVSLG